MRRPRTRLRNVEPEIDFLAQIQSAPPRDRPVGLDATEPDIVILALSGFCVDQHVTAAVTRSGLHGSGELEVDLSVTGALRPG